MAQHEDARTADYIARALTQTFAETGSRALRDPQTHVLVRLYGVATLRGDSTDHVEGEDFGYSPLGWECIVEAVDVGRQTVAVTEAESNNVQDVINYALSRAH